MTLLKLNLAYFLLIVYDVSFAQAGKLSFWKNFNPIAFKEKYCFFHFNY
jgi:hypothetical protein